VASARAEAPSTLYEIPPNHSRKAKNKKVSVLTIDILVVAAVNEEFFAIMRRISE